MQNNFIFELIPLIIFFSVYYFTKNLFIATGVLIVVSWIQLIFYKIKYKNISKNTLISTILITIFGGLTIALHNKTFVMLKTTILFFIFGTSLLIGQLIGKNPIRLMLSKEITLPEKIWSHLNIMWVSFFYALGLLNLYIAFNLSEYIWVKFKVFGITGGLLIGTLVSGLYIFIQQNKIKK